MKTKRSWIHRSFPALLTAAILGAIALGACAPQTSVAGLQRQGANIVRETVVVEKEVSKVVEQEAGKGQALPTPAPALSNEPGAPGSGTDTTILPSPYRVNQMIIKNAELKLVVEDTRVGIDQLTQVAADTFGYILSSRTWYQGAYQYATLTIGVPATEFENAMRRIRALALRVEDETASGTDVTDQYVSAESRLRNLEATEARIRSFLDKAATVEESLQVNQRLAEITAQIEELKGQMNYLRDRAAYSTITVHLAPEPPVPTPTPVPIPTPDTWNPGDTFVQATGVLGGILRVVGDVVIWGSVVFGPFLLPAALIVWLGIRLQRGRQRPE